MKRTAFIFSLLFVCISFVSARDGYKITLQIDGNKDSVMYLGYYYGKDTRVADTAFNNGKGKFVFQGTREFLPGLYFFTNGRPNEYIDFVIYHEEPFFQFHTEQDHWDMSMRVKGSKQNEVFFNFQRANARLYSDLEAAKHELDSAAYEQYRQKAVKSIDSVKYDLIERYPDMMVAKMISATQEIVVPQVDSTGAMLSDRQRFEYFLAHNFDYMPLDDDFIVRTPRMVFYQKVMDYVDKSLHGMPPAMICPLLDTLIDRSEPAPEVFKWLVHTLTEKYLQSNIMVYDEVYVHLIQRYYATGKAFWSSPSFIDEQVERANRWERLLVGREAPELVLFDTLRDVHSLHHMPGELTLLLFWSPTCGHCRDIIPALYQVFEEYSDSLDLSAFAILTEPDENTVPKWKKFLADHHMTSPRWVNLNGGEANVDWREVYDVNTTPQVYLIDNASRKILAKKLNATIFRDLCGMLVRQKEQRKSTNNPD